ncbi:hypothetical protein QVD17_16579 [Tagetes erecta]|uniref:Uncharacterized protein n=1 Tax=Tagetes erecta TaxID=13708 RepID=A0AAD8P0M9_TARER|nr:hypothetical protein QVD17_16579 [Tagetes erecta]
MNVRIFADCAAPRYNFSGKITYLFRNMYTDERWEYIEKLKAVEERRFEEQRDRLGQTKPPQFQNPPGEWPVIPGRNRWVNSFP